MGLLDRFKKIKEGLSRTRTNFVDKISKIITGKTKIDDELIDEIEEALLSADVGYTATEKIVGDIRAGVKDENNYGNEKYDAAQTEDVRNRPSLLNAQDVVQSDSLRIFN